MSIIIKPRKKRARRLRCTRCQKKNLVRNLMEWRMPHYRNKHKHIRLCRECAELLHEFIGSWLGKGRSGQPHMPEN